MASISTIACRSFNDVLPMTPNAAPSSVRRHLARLLPLAAGLVFSLHCAAARAGDIARDTPAASMTLAQGLYATPGPSASVSSVTTPTITASPLPSAPAPVVISAAAAPSLIAPAPPAKAPETAWINYVAVIAGIVGALAGIAGGIMGGLALHRAKGQARRY